ncbi:MAG: Crp/Fnr family transcriptional regulator, partial [Bacillota bacterium]|jgi:CRP-like cAMP-binding protein|nr:Crp/Fnr family transcriptional regulator [Bacillota bacterium]
MINGLKESALFQDMAPEEINDCIALSGAQIRTYKKNEIIFNALDVPKSAFVLIDGDILIYRATLSGKRDIFLHIEDRGDVFGEVYLFMERPLYEYYAVTLQPTTVLEIPKDYFYFTCSENCTHHTTLIRNMMRILAKKAFHFNLKLQILASGTLRQKIIRYLIENMGQSRVVTLSMSREMFADYLNVARPSLSRELLKMEDEGLILINGRRIEITDLQMLEDQL